MTRKIEEHYADLLQEQSDATTHRLVQDLHRAYTTATPAVRPGWEDLMARARSTNQEKQAAFLPRWQPIPKFSLGFAPAIALLLVLIIVVSVAAKGFIPEQVYEILGMTNAGHQQLVQGQYTELDITKKIHGIPVKLNAAYADANMVVVGYTATVNNDSDSTAFVARLKTKGGQDFEALSGMGTDENKNKEIASTWMFDGSIIEGNPQNLDLVLELSLDKEKTSFEFSVPFHKSQVLTLHKSVTTNGQTATLEKVIIAPSGAQLIVSGLAKDFGLYAGYSTLKVPGKKADTFTMVGPFQKEPHATTFIFTEPIQHKSGTWSFTLIQRQLPRPVAPNNIPNRKWVFNFVVS